MENNDVETIRQTIGAIYAASKRGKSIAEIYDASPRGKGDAHAALTRLRDRLYAAETALKEIRDQDWTENMLDPQWSGRIASLYFEENPGSTSSPAP